MRKCTIYPSSCFWPVSLSRLHGGWLIRFFWLTLIVDAGDVPLVRRRRRARLTPEPKS